MPSIKQVGGGGVTPTSCVMSFMPIFLILSCSFSLQYGLHLRKKRLKIVLLIKSVFYVGPPKEDIFLTSFYGLYFSHNYTYYKLQSLHIFVFKFKETKYLFH